MSVAFRSLAFLLFLSGTTVALADPPTAKAKPTQYVLISFDGAGPIAQWQRSRTLAARTDIRFTYFLSCVFLLSPETRKVYRAPHKAAGASNVGFGLSKEDVAARLGQIRLASAEGHELASHGCGHFDGKGWSEADWRKEFAAFSYILRDAYTINGIAPEPADWRDIAASVDGFRAPYLSTGKGLYSALDKTGFAYDASGVSRGAVQPDRDHPVARFDLPQIPEGPAGRRVIAMDYNLYVRHSGGFERPGEADAFEERTYRAFSDAFAAQYDGARIALQLGFHFTLMNDGAYWQALERFAAETCVKPDVACVSYRDYLEATKPTATPSAGIGG